MKKRGSWLAVFIRGTWTFLLPGISWAVIYAFNNLTGFGLQWYWCLFIGAMLYATKKRFFPDTTL